MSGYILDKKSREERSPYEPAPRPTVAMPTGSPVVTTTAAVTTTLDIPLVATSTWRSYRDSASGFEASFPADMIDSVREGSLVLVFPKSLYFSWPLLDESTVRLTVSSRCPATDGVIAGARSKDDETGIYSWNGYEWRRRRVDSAGSGSRYRTIVYDLVQAGKCHHLEFRSQGAVSADVYVDSASLSKKYDAEHASNLEKVISVLHTIASTYRPI